MSTFPELQISAPALRELRRFQAEGASDRVLYLRVTGVAGAEFEHALSLESPEVAAPGDARERIEDLDVVVAAGSAARLEGARIDWVSEPRMGFRVANPNRPGPDDELAMRVRRVLEERLNPGIALHGGRADLVAVEDRTAYVRLSGGCQGCGMASATLTQGIETVLGEEIPEIAGVVDVTDHASGTNPYYASSR